MPVLSQVDGEPQPTLLSRTLASFARPFGDAGAWPGAAALSSFFGLVSVKIGEDRRTRNESRPAALGRRDGLEDPQAIVASELFWIVKNGIKMTGMSSWRDSLSDGEIWEVVAWLGATRKLPPQTYLRWRSAMRCEPR